VLGAPTVTSPKFALDGVTERLGLLAAEPVPLSGNVCVGLVGSLLTMLTLPLTLPAAAGVNVTVACTDWPPPIVCGMLIPLVVKSVPATVKLETVRFAFPAFVSTRFVVPFEPTSTLPKSIALGPTDNFGWPAATAVAVKLAAAGELPESPVTVNVPVTVPAAFAFTATVKLIVCPTPNAAGVVIPETVNCGFDTDTCVMFNATFPEFTIDTVCVAAFPTVTFPKVTLVELSWKEACAGVCFELAVTPAAHPFNQHTHPASNSSATKFFWIGFSVKTRSQNPTVSARP
jgi:hypothetical protein